MNEAATGEGKGMKWALRLVAPFCLMLVLVLGWQEHEMAVKAKQVFDAALGGEPIPGLSALFVLDSFPWSCCVISVALIAYSSWSLEQSDSKMGWGLSLSLATFFAVALLALAHLALHRLPFTSVLQNLGNPIMTFHPPPPEHECPVCHGWKSWPQK